MQIENQNFTYGKTLSSLITLLLVELRQHPPADELTARFITQKLREKHPLIDAYIKEEEKKHFKYIVLRVRSTLKELSQAGIVKIEQKQTKIKTPYYTYILC